MRGLKLALVLKSVKKLLSHLLQMRGLKHQLKHALQIHDKVASFTDAWIETIQTKMKAYLSLSHLLQMRGLKLINPEARKKALDVASFTDAWIETLPNSGAFSKERSRIFYRCVD